MTTKARIALVLLGMVLLVGWPVASQGAPAEQADSSCLACHQKLSGRAGDVVDEWRVSIHAAAGIGCEDCHGGDPTAQDQAAAMSPAAGFRATLPRTQIPDLCGSCHADPQRMAPFGLPVDQLELYRHSVHGRRLAQGDVNVATCYDCHGGHAVRESNDPESSIYPVNLPATCGRCHADPQRMAPYDIATNQLELFKNSVHGIALLREHNLKAPTCATCHGSHGATLPGQAEVVDLCGATCHPAVEYAYVTGAHALSEAPTPPNCVTCHGRYDVHPASPDIYLQAGPRGCKSCHPAGSPEAAVAQQFHDELASAERCLNATRSTLERAEGAGLDVGRLRIQFMTAETELVLARVAQHSVNPALVSSHTQRVSETCSQVASATEGMLAQRENWRRARTAGVVAALAGLAVVGVGIALSIVSWRSRS